MKYTNYVINGRFIDLDSIQSNNVILKLPVLLISLTAGLMMLGMLVTVLPVAVVADESRTLKYQYIKLKRHYGIRK